MVNADRQEMLSRESAHPYQGGVICARSLSGCQVGEIIVARHYFAYPCQDARKLLDAFHDEIHCTKIGTVKARDKRMYLVEFLEPGRIISMFFSGSREWLTQRRYQYPGHASLLNCCQDNTEAS